MSLGSGAGGPFPGKIKPGQAPGPAGYGAGAIAQGRRLIHGKRGAATCRLSTATCRPIRRLRKSAHAPQECRFRTSCAQIDSPRNSAPCACHLGYPAGRNCRQEPADFAARQNLPGRASRRLTSIPLQFCGVARAPLTTLGGTPIARHLPRIQSFGPDWSAHRT